MPIYDYFCEKCDDMREIEHKMNEKPEIICDCGEIMQKAISRNIQVVLRGNNWTGKDLREKNYRLKKRQEIGKRMVQNYDVPQLQPNYKGEICKSWEDAGKIAKNNGVDPLKYESQIKNLKQEQNKLKEKKIKLARGEI